MIRHRRDGAIDFGLVLLVFERLRGARGSHTFADDTLLRTLECKEWSPVTFDGGRTLSEFDDAAQARDSDGIRATARLPSLTIEIVHRRTPDGDAEEISINLQAVPSFEAFGRFVETMSPFAFWAHAMQMAWLPWLAAVQTFAPPRLALPQIAPDGSRSADSFSGST
jgi:hypothetical protein